MKYEELRVVWVSSFWDVPLEGLCRPNGKLMMFREAATDGEYLVVSLNLHQKARWLLRKWLFELCVGKHWTFPQPTRVHFHWRRPLWLHKAMFWAYYKMLQPLLKEAA